MLFEKKCEKKFFKTKFLNNCYVNIHIQNTVPGTLRNLYYFGEPDFLRVTEKNFLKQTVFGHA